jgi:cytochrome c oxidase subunit II
MPLVDVSPLHCAGPGACRIVDLYVLIFWVAMVVMLVVGGLLVYAALRFRRRDEVEPAQVHGNSKLELAWTGAPFLILLVIFLFTFANMDYIRNGPANKAMTVKVTGQQFAWTFNYPDPKVRTDTLYIPVGQPVELQVTSRDVLHAFWVPRLGQEIYAIPGQTNHGWIQASKAGNYFGQCNELCGTGHWIMQLRVVAMPKAQYDAWYAKIKKQLGG